MVLKKKNCNNVILKRLIPFGCKKNYIIKTVYEGENKRKLLKSNHKLKTIENVFFLKEKPLNKFKLQS